MPEQFFVYLVECSDKSLYCGSTNDVEARLNAHNDGKASKYTRARRPVKLVFLEGKKTRQAALKREAQIKALNRKQKQELVASFLKGKKH